MDNVFIDRLSYWIFRMAVATALAAGRVDAKRMKHLLQTAMYDELRAQGFGHSRMAARLGCSPATIKSWADAAIKPPSWPESGPMTLRILKLLEDHGGTLDEFKLEELAGRGDVKNGEEEVPGFALEYELALRSLQEWGHVVKSVDSVDRFYRYELTDAYWQLANSSFNLPILDEAQALEDLLALAHYLNVIGPAREGELLTLSAQSGHGVPAERVKAALALSRKLENRLGSSVLMVSGQGDSGLWSIHPEGRLFSQDTATEVQVATLRLIKHTRDFLVWLAQEPPEEEISQKETTFLIRRADLPGFLKRQQRRFLRAAYAAEAAASGAADAVVYRFVWYGNPLDRRG